jgi:two-component system, OmpR family, sensor histidine kinase BaeS
MRSLTLKLTLAFLLVSVVGAVLVALLVNWQTQREFDQLVYNLYQDDLENLSSQLAAYHQENGNWEGIGAVLIADEQWRGGGHGAGSHYLPVTLVDDNRRVIYGGQQYRPGDILPRRILNKGVPIEVNGETIGWVVLASFGGPNSPGANSPEANFLARVNRATIYSALGAALAALLFGALLARTISHPMTELKAATQLVAQGQLGHQVPVRSQDEIGQLAASFNQMSADLARSNELRRQMTADIAHDLRTPLSVIQGYTEALDEGKLHGNQGMYRAMHLQVQHLTRLVEDLRILSLADAGQLPLLRQPVDPAALLEHSALAYMAQAEQQKIALHVDVAPDLPPANLDADRMIQVLNNLVSNALRYTTAGGEIHLSAEKSNGDLRLKVQDSGAGIAAEDLPFVFERFYRGDRDRSRSDSGESGLGLAIARSIVEAHGGRITVESAPGAGTTFTMTIPEPGKS